MQQAELQQDIQRVVSVFMDRISQAAEPSAPNEAPQRTEHLALLERVLLYNASALDIATGPYPEINMLDMLVFTHLCRTALTQHWMPNALGKHGEALVKAFTASERETWDVATKVLDPHQQKAVRESIAAWESEHPRQFRVEGVRFQEFSEHAGAIENESARKSRGVLGQLRSATRSADQALLVGERAFFLIHRMPFLMRLQARVGVQETLFDSFAHSRRWLMYAVLAGLGWTLLFWVGYFIVTRLT